MKSLENYMILSTINSLKKKKKTKKPTIEFPPSINIKWSVQVILFFNKKKIIC